MAGASWFLTSAIPKRMYSLRTSEKKLRDTLTEIDHAWQAEGQLRLIFQDEARFGHVSDTRRYGCPKPIRSLCQAMITQQSVYAYAVVSVAHGELDTLVLPQVNSHCMQLFLNEVASRHPNDRVILVPYSSELKPVENLWDELWEKSFHNRVFDSLGTLENHLEAALRNMEKDRACVQSIVAWPWIINSFMKKKWNFGDFMESKYVFYGCFLRFVSQ